MSRPIAVLDCETTGTNPDSDRIIDLSIVYVVNGRLMPERLTYRFNPGIPIPAEATAVHGITDADVQAFPPFLGAARGLAGILTPVHLAGYAPRLLDLPLLAAEFERAEVDWDFDGQIIDVRGIWMKKAPRDLSGAVKTFLGEDLVGAHSAVTDALKTAQVFLAQVAVYPELAKMRTDELARFSQAGDVELVDLAGRLYRDKDGDLALAFGKERGQKVRDRRSYASWMLSKNFPANTLRHLRAELDRIDGIVVNETTGNREAGIPF